MFKNNKILLIILFVVIIAIIIYYLVSKRKKNNSKESKESNIEKYKIVYIFDSIDKLEIKLNKLLPKNSFPAGSKVKVVGTIDENEPQQLKQLLNKEIVVMKEYYGLQENATFLTIPKIVSTNYKILYPKNLFVIKI